MSRTFRTFSTGQYTKKQMKYPSRKKYGRNKQRSGRYIDLSDEILS